MINHKKTYEDVFSSDYEGNRQRLNLDNITYYGMESDEYISLFHNFLTDFYSSLFLDCVKLSWLRRKFTYLGKKTILPMNKNSRFMGMAFVKLMRRNIGHDLQIITKGNFFSKLELYFDEMFPGFEEGNPFENPDYYKFPYKNISVEYLIVVHQLDDRFGLLEKAEEEKMSFAIFLDYVINHVYTENEILGRDRYQVSLNQDRKASFYVRDTDKKLVAIKGQKRP